MTDENNSKNVSGAANVDSDADYDELQKAGKKGLFGRFSKSIDDAIQQGRGPEHTRDAVVEAQSKVGMKADDLALRRARTVTSQKMIIPEGVIIEGSLTGGTDTEISGKIEGDITVDGRLYLGKSALVSGNIRAGSCKVDGLVEGVVECTDTLELGPSGRLSANVTAGKRIDLAGEVYGDVTTPGALHLGSSCKVHGNVRVRNLHMDEGAELNGSCQMQTPAQRDQMKK